MEFKTCEEYVLTRLHELEEENDKLRNLNKAYNVIIDDYNRIFTLLELQKDNVWGIHMHSKYIGEFHPENDELLKLLDTYGLFKNDEINEKGESNE